MVLLVVVDGMLSCGRLALVVIGRIGVGFFGICGANNCRG